MAGFTRVTGRLLKSSLVHRLNPVANRMRDLMTRVGLRAYVVRIVRTRWTGGRRGKGEEVVVSELELLPTPKLVDLSTLTEVLQPIGLDEVGDIQISQINPDLTEEQLRGASGDGTPVGPDENVYYEIEFPNAAVGGDSFRRRFVLRSAPYYAPGRFQWNVMLHRARGDRARDGEVR